VFNFLFKGANQKLLEEKNRNLSKDLDALAREVTIVKSELETLKQNFAETQMSLNILITATQGVAEDLSIVYNAVMGPEKSAANVLSFSYGQVEDDDYEN